MTTHRWRIGNTKLVLHTSHTRDTYAARFFDASGRVIAYCKAWGPSGADAFRRAAYLGDLAGEARGAFIFLFARIDGYRDRPGVLDMITDARYDGPVVRATKEMHRAVA